MRPEGAQRRSGWGNATRDLERFICRRFRAEAFLQIDTWG